MPAGGVLVVPGNLWLEPLDQPLELLLSSDLVIFIEGNLHLLRSLRVRGPGRAMLVTVAAPGEVIFADVDGSGGWSNGDRLRVGAEFAGAVEGAANVYLGLPGSTQPVCCDAGILVGGELHLATQAEVRGPLMLRYGATKLPNPAAPHGEVCLREPGEGSWVFAPGRDRVPGFELVGRPRAGRLQFRLR